MDKKLNCITHLLQINKIQGKQEGICCIEVVYIGVELRTGEEFSFLRLRIQTNPEAHSTSYSFGIRDSLRKNK
jgi:hypothetical protein